MRQRLWRRRFVRGYRARRRSRRRERSHARARVITITPPRHASLGVRLDHTFSANARQQCSADGTAHTSPSTPWTRTSSRTFWTSASTITHRIYGIGIRWIGIRQQKRVADSRCYQRQRCDSTDFWRQGPKSLPSPRHTRRGCKLHNPHRWRTCTSHAHWHCGRMLDAKRRYKNIHCHRKVNIHQSYDRQYGTLGRTVASGNGFRNLQGQIGMLAQQTWLHSHNGWTCYSHEPGFTPRRIPFGYNSRRWVLSGPELCKLPGTKHRGTHARHKWATQADKVNSVEELR